MATAASVAASGAASGAAASATGTQLIYKDGLKQLRMFSLGPRPFWPRKTWKYPMRELDQPKQIPNIHDAALQISCHFPKSAAE